MNFTKEDMLPLTENTLLDGKVRLKQPETGFRVTSDSVFLAAAVNAASGDRVLEVGCGSGAASLCLMSRVREIRVVGIEIDPRLTHLAQDNLSLNGFGEYFEAITADLVKPPPRLTPHSFDHVFGNPPYFLPDKGTLPSGDLRIKAQTEGSVNLAAWVSFSLRMAKPGATITLIQSTERLGEILDILSKRAGDILLCPLWSKNPLSTSSSSAKRIIVQARAGIMGPMKLLGGIVLHEKDGRFSVHAEKILREGKGLDLPQRG
tara:strand:+ start:45531 stop:46316 length:786 start_codon:yes stop_codon:yes gene_type:complete